MFLRPRDIPNLLTAVRIVLVAPLLWCVLEGRYPQALALFLVAGVTDGLDGFLAKYYGWTSWLGGILDPLADKLLLVTMVVALGVQGALPLWLVNLIILRDLVIVIGALAYHWLIEPFQARPLLVSKLNTLFQLILVLVVLFAKGAIPLPQELLNLLIYSTAFTTLVSGIAYVWRWGRLALRKRSRVHAE